MSHNQSEPLIVCIKGVEQRYGKRIALHSIDLEIPGNCRVGFIGPDGVGKSSLMALISGARKIQKGTVEVLGGDMNDIRHRKAAYSRIAYMPQGLGKNLYMSLSVFENIDFFGRLFGQQKAERESRIEELLESTKLAAFRDRPAGKLSGGMKQKLGLCCALIHDPDLLILDEPTTGVDPLSRRQFWELVNRIRLRREGMGVLISTAYMDEAQSFDWLVAMDDGKILATGTPQELMAQTGTNNLDAAFIQLLPQEKRTGHKALTVPPRAVKADEVPAIQASGLTRQFGAFTAVDHVSFKIARGEIFGFLGSNGCGKSTTMKMLTGLLPATEGSAQMLGQPVKADDLDTRRRVGVMSQAFSLYTELTVRQNLVLHAQLFHLPPEKIPGRIQDMIRQFGLNDYMEELAEKLPLGVRQRLSLAVAMIHSPELLILDEPTSGVDPVARDNFWELLIKLSREANVTIFVSTHFMNEAMLCDRISLMHAGKVLTSDKPAKIIQDRGAKNLEEAFISHLEEAQSAQAIGKDIRPETPKRVSLPQPSAKKGLRFLRMLGYAYREMLEILRDPIRLAFALGGTVLLMFVLGYGINQDVENISFAALDRDKTPLSRDYIQNIAGSRYFDEKPEIIDDGDLDRRMRTGKLSIGLEIPSGYGRDVKRGKTPEIGAWVDGAMPFRAQTIHGYLQGMHSEYLSRAYGQPSAGEAEPSTYYSPLETRYRYNQDYKSLYSMVPATIPLLLMMIPAMLMALGIVREKELGTITNFYTTPVTKLEFLLGKQLPYVGLAMVNFAALVLMAVFLFKVPFKGSFLALTMGAFLYVICSTSLGLVMSIFTDTQMAAVFGTMITTMLPATLFSGLNVPVASLEGAGRIMGMIYPTTYFMIISRGTFTKALSFADLGHPFFVLALTSPILILIGIIFLKKQEQ